MGLDMYMQRREKSRSNDDPSGESSDDMGVDLAYWRKFNALHNWFVNRVQKGVDDCGFYVVEKEHLEELKETLTDSLNKKEPFLKPASGFFFGSTDIDDYYWEQCQYTLERVEEALDETEFDKEDILYFSSW